MKPKNFPARKNARRISAIKRLLVAGAKNQSEISRFNIGKAVENTNKKIINHDAARAIRTKKFRG